MNLHTFLDHYTTVVGALLAGRSTFFSRSVDCPDFSTLLAGTELHLPEIAGEGIYETPAASPAGAVDPALYIAQWLGPAHPTLIYHHGNKERQRRCYDPARITVQNRGHATGALNAAALRGFLLAQLGGEYATTEVRDGDDI